MLLYYVYYILKKEKVSRIFIFSTLLSIILFVPLPTIAFLGLEHTLQSLIFLIFMYNAYVIIKYKRENQSRCKFSKKIILLISPLVVSVRFEGFFILVIIVLLLLLNREFLYSFLVTILSILPIVIYGLISTVNRWFFLPNSIILKGGLSSLDYIKWLDFFESYFFLYTHISILLIAAILIFFLTIILNKGVHIIKKNTLSISFIFITLCYYALIFNGAIDHLFWMRYYSNLTCIGIVIIVMSIKDLNIFYQVKRSFDLLNIGVLRREFLKSFTGFCVGFTLFLLIIPQLYRGYIVLSKTYQSSINIYHQQYQMGLFVKKYYNSKNIAINDIGAVNYISDVNSLDVLGLGNMDSAILLLTHNYNNYTIDTLTRQYNCTIAIVYWNYYDDTRIFIPIDWIYAGKWNLKNNVVCGGSSVYFYAVQPTAIDQLIDNLHDFTDSLPEDVGYYIASYL